MTYLVTEKCINCKYTDCVDVCPADCFYEGPNSVVIMPSACVDCGLCVDQCPVNAIVPESDLSAEKRQYYFDLNQQFAQRWPNIIESKQALDNADEWANNSEDKIKYLQTS